MTSPDPRRAIITGQLVGRKIAELGDLIRAEKYPDVRAITCRPWDSMEQSDRDRLGEIGNDLLVFLDDLGVLKGDQNRALLKRVTRDHLGRPLGSPPPAGARAGAAPTCACGRPETLGVVHRLDGPCFVYEQTGPPLQ